MSSFFPGTAMVRIYWVRLLSGLRRGGVGRWLSQMFVRSLVLSYNWRRCRLDTPSRCLYVSSQLFRSGSWRYAGIFAKPIGVRGIKHGSNSGREEFPRCSVRDCNREPCVTPSTNCYQDLGAVSELCLHIRNGRARSEIADLVRVQNWGYNESDEDVINTGGLVWGDFLCGI